MDAQPEPIQGSTEPKKNPEQATQRTTSALAKAPGNVKGVVTARDTMMSDHADEGRGVYTSKQTAALRPTEHSTDVPQRRASARIAGRPEPVERNPIGPYPSSLTQDQESLKPRAPRRLEQPEQAIIQQGGGSRWDDLPARVDALSAEMRTVRSALRELQQEKHEKAALQKDLEEAQNKLQKNTVALSGLQQDKHEKIALQKELHETLDRLRKTTGNLEDIRKKWKKATSQLDQLRSQETVLHQLSDSDLTRSVQQLRFSIRNFSLQYFEGKSHGQSRNIPAGDFWKYMHETTPGSDYLIYLRSETRGPIVIQAFLWRLLVGEVFEKFCWAPRLKSSITDVYQVLQPSTYYDESGVEIPIAPEAKRRFQMWKATTSALILESMEGDDQADSQKLVEDFSSNFSEQVFDVINPFVRNLDEGISNDLRHIIETSITLDQEIFRQAALVDWVFPPSGDLVPFDPDCMAADMGEETPEPGQYIGIAVTPALKKQGRSTGDNFETGYLLLKMGVTCVLSSPGPYFIERGPGMS